MKLHEEKKSNQLQQYSVEYKEQNEYNQPYHHEWHKGNVTILNVQRVEK